MSNKLYAPVIFSEGVDINHKGAEHSVPDINDILQSKITFEIIDGKRYVVIKVNPLGNWRNAAFKRIFDIFFSFFVIIFVLSWLTPLLAILIKLDSNGPVFYRQKRAGRHDIVFNCLKFRTMVDDRHAEFKSATKNDNRVTRLGRFLRKTSIDEFAQFYNVFWGHMSIVGPRPHPLKLNDDYVGKVEKYMVRHVVKPGVTGLSQAKGHRGEVFNTLTMKQRVKIDIFYIENWSFMFDLKIIALTIYNLVKGDKNAY